MTTLEQLRSYAKAELADGKQITWNTAFAISRPALRQIRHWYPDVPAELRKAQAVEWLAEKAAAEVHLVRQVAP